MAEVLKLITPEAPRPAPGGFVLTETVAEIMKTLRFAAAYPGEYVGLVAGKSGTGKSKAVMHYKNTARGVLLHSVAAGEGGAWNIATELARILDVEPPNARIMPESRRCLAEEIGIDRMLIIDEAQNLVQRNPKGRDNWEAFEWLRAMAEEGCFALAFCGDLQLCEIRERLPQLWRRMARRQIVRNVTKADVALVAEAHGYSAAAALEELFGVARRGGALGDVALCCRHAAIIAGDRAPSFDDLVAAIEDLNLKPGVK